METIIVFSLFPSDSRGFAVSTDFDSSITFSGSDEISSRSKCSPDFSYVYGDFSILIFLLPPKPVLPFLQWEIVTTQGR